MERTFVPGSGFHPFGASPSGVSKRGTVYMHPYLLEEGLTDNITLNEDLVEQDPQIIAIQSCYKTAIPIARLWELVNQDDISDNLSYRCPKCSQCMECKYSNKVRAMSVQERCEQVVIEETNTLDLERRIVTVQLPFMKDPVKPRGQVPIRL